MTWTKYGRCLPKRSRRSLSRPRQLVPDGGFACVRASVLCGLLSVEAMLNRPHRVLKTAGRLHHSLSSDQGAHLQSERRRFRCESLLLLSGDTISCVGPNVNSETEHHLEITPFYPLPGAAERTWARNGHLRRAYRRSRDCCGDPCLFLHSAPEIGARLVVCVGDCGGLQSRLPRWLRIACHHPQHDYCTQHRESVGWLDRPPR